MHLKENAILAPPLILPSALIRLDQIATEIHTLSNQFATGTTVNAL